MESRPTVAVALLAVLVLGGCTAGYQPTPAAPEPGPTPADPDAHLGYYDGYWHNDTFDVDASDGLTPGQTEAIVDRAMARVQLLRGLRFEEDVEVELVTRETFREEYGGVTAPTRDGPRGTLDNAQFEAMLLVGPDRDVAAVRGDNRGSNILGFYRPGPGDIVLVSEAVPATLGDEYTLAHELVHALQDQEFGLGSIRAHTLDGRNARNGLVEGDALVVQQAYEERCASGEWQCVETDAGGTAPGVGSDFHYGVYYAGFVPYAEGPSFVRYHRERGGWAEIDPMYDRPPRTSAELVHPATYGTDTYGTATLSDRSDPEWRRVTVENGTSYATVGQGGLASMFAYTLRDQYRPNDSVIPREAFFNVRNGRLDPRRPFTYDVAPAAGWYGDRLHAYTGDGGTAYVWNVTFRDRANATEFRRGHADLLRYWGATRVGEDHAKKSRGGTDPDRDPNGVVWRFDGSSQFEGAIWVRQDGASLVVVKAPRAAALDDVYEPAPAS